MIKRLLVLSTLLLSGCFYQTIDNGDIQRATAFCADKDGIHRLASHFSGYEAVECLSGARSYLPASRP